VTLLVARLGALRGWREGGGQSRGESKCHRPVTADSQRRPRVATATHAPCKEAARSAVSPRRGVVSPARRSLRDETVFRDSNARSATRSDAGQASPRNVNSCDGPRAQQHCVRRRSRARNSGQQLAPVEARIALLLSRCRPVVATPGRVRLAALGTYHPKLTPKRHLRGPAVDDQLADAHSPSPSRPPAPRGASLEATAALGDRFLSLQRDPPAR